MSKPTEEQLRALFDNCIAREWVEEQLESQVLIEYGEGSAQNIEYSNDSVECTVVKSSCCSCCGDEVLGYTSVYLDHLIEELSNPDAMTFSERLADKQRQDEELAEEARLVEEAKRDTRELEEYMRLNRKFS